MNIRIHGISPNFLSSARCAKQRAAALMGIMASALQMVENVMGKIVQGLLMPKVAPDWYAGTRRLTEFPEASAESLLLMAFVTLEVPDMEVAMNFFIKGLGAKEGAEVDGARVVQVGASQLRLVSSSRSDLAAWPGQFYIWVEDSRATLASCQAFEKSGSEVIQEVHHIKEEGAADAILLHDPAGQNLFVVNQAPVGGMAKTMRSILPGTDKVSNALALVGLTHPIAEGQAGGVVRFYSHFLGASVSKTKQGYAVDFSLGKALHQTLTFVEDGDAQLPGETPGEKLAEVCLYVVSMEKLKAVYDKCFEAGLVEATWEEVEKCREFCFSRCPDPADKKIVLELPGPQVSQRALAPNLLQIGTGVLSAYARCLRLIAGLSSGPPMEWLTDRVRAGLNPDLVMQLASDPAVVALRQRIEGADEVSASVLRHLCTDQNGAVGPDSIGRAMRSFAHTLDPNLCLQSVMLEESRVTEVWADALELPPALAFPFQSLRRVEPVGRSVAATLLCGENMRRVQPLFSIRHGQGWNQQVSDLPPWVADLVPPAPYSAVFGEGDCAGITPLEVLYGCVQDMPVWQTPMVVSSDVGLAWPAALCSEMPWRFFVSMVQDQTLFQEYKNNWEESSGKVSAFTATARASEVNQTGGGGGSKAKKKRKKAKEEEVREFKRLRQDENVDEERRGSPVGGPGLYPGGKYEHEVQDRGESSVGSSRQKYGHTQLSAKSKAIPVGHGGSSGHRDLPGALANSAVRPVSPSRSPLPHQRASIARKCSGEDGGHTKLYPPDWQCPTTECVNHVKMVFAKKEKCPVCGARKPSSITWDSSTERMRGGTRRYHPAPRDVSPGREHSDRRAYTGAVLFALHPPSPHSTNGSVGFPVSFASLQAATLGLQTGGSEVGDTKIDQKISDGFHTGPSEDMVGIEVLGAEVSFYGFQTNVAEEVVDANSVGDTSFETNGIHLATGPAGCEPNQVVGCLYQAPQVGNHRTRTPPCVCVVLPSQVDPARVERSRHPHPDVPAEDRERVLDTPADETQEVRSFVRSVELGVSPSKLTLRTLKSVFGYLSMFFGLLPPPLWYRRLSPSRRTPEAEGRSVSGPAILAGDFNCALTVFEDMKGLLADGWVDAALFDAQRRGQAPEPTCQRATRHTFCVVSPLLAPMVRVSQVCFHEDLATHAVLVTEFDLPRNNMRVYKWIMPKALDGVAIDAAKLQVLADQVGSDRWHTAVDEPLNAGKVDDAFANWSEIAETVLLSSVNERDLDVSKPAWSGRGKLVEPVLRTWAPPRFHAGRPGDFRLALPSVALQARRWQKLVRQLEALLRKLRAGCRGGDSRRFEEETQCIWLAIVGSPIRPRFPRWAFDTLGFVLHYMPGPEILEALYAAAASHAHEVSKQCWKAKRATFVSQVEESWNTRGGSFAFRMLREQTHPPVMEMRVRTPVLLAPQRWLPDGKQWIHVRDVTGFQAGDRLEGPVECAILEVQGNSLRLDTRLSRKEAAGLEKVEVSLDPEVWSRAFFQGWSAYWQRECVSADETPWRQLLETLPPVGEQPLEAISFSEWKHALGRAKTSSMRGTCGWSVGELKRLPECVVLPLLRLFNRIERGVGWPKQLQQWLVVLLRKEEGIPEWSSVRPISVASVVYRIWSRIRTRQLLAVCQTSSLPTVGPRLSTRSLWGYVADFAAEEMHAGNAPAGLVLDIVKAFNVLCRPMVGDVMRHCGIDGNLVDAWLRALDGMERYVLVAGNVYRADPSFRVSSTGVPEGDPLSVVAMYCMCRFFALWVQSKATVMPLTYADNWQVLSSDTRPVLEALPHVAEFLTRCSLPISPHKCWLWSASRQGRKTLKAATLGEDQIPVKLQAVDLGADLPCKGGPMFEAGRVASLAKPGVSPWVACSVGACQTIDPAFCLLLQRIRLFRLMWRDFPQGRARMRRGLISLRSGTGGVSYLLAKQLRGFGWLPVGLEARDDYGRVLHLVETPLKTVTRVLETSWLDQVATNVRHRKACEQVQHIDPELSRTWMKFPLAEQSLLLTQVTGVTYTRDCLSHAVGLEVSRACPLCGSDDSRLHRVKFCEAVQCLRAPFLACLDQRTLPDHTWAYGLWDEPPEARKWQASMCEIGWPPDFVSSVGERQFVFTDGSCLSPRNPRLSVAGGAVILAHRFGGYDVVWAGLVPGLEQSSYRAEVLAITVALSTFSCVTVFCDNWEVVRVATRLLRMPPGQRESCLPSEHQDLWRFFCLRTAERSWGSSVVRWVKAHQNPVQLHGEARILATINGYADAEAKKVVVSRARHETYRELFTAVQTGKDLAAKLADLHVAIAQAFVEVDQVQGLPLDPSGFAVCGRGGAGSVFDAGSQVHDAFGDALVRWLNELRWYGTCAAGWTYTSAVELLWQFIYDTGKLPPFWYEGKWCVLDESVLNSFVLPRMSRLYRAWVQALRGVVGLELVGGVEAVPFAGTGLAGWSVEGRISMDPAVIDDLSCISRKKCGVRSLRLPSFW
eukprot:s103_g17.t1